MRSDSKLSARPHTSPVQAAGTCFPRPICTSPTIHERTPKHALARDNAPPSFSHAESLKEVFEADAGNQSPRTPIQLRRSVSMRPMLHAEAPRRPVSASPYTAHIESQLRHLERHCHGLEAQVWPARRSLPPHPPHRQTHCITSCKSTLMQPHARSNHTLDTCLCCWPWHDKCSRAAHPILHLHRQCASCNSPFLSHQQHTAQRMRLLMPGRSSSPQHRSLTRASHSGPRGRQQQPPVHPYTHAQHAVRMHPQQPTNWRFACSSLFIMADARTMLRLQPARHTHSSHACFSCCRLQRQLARACAGVAFHI